MSAGWDDGHGEAVLRRLFMVQLVAMGAMEMSGPFWPMHLRDLGGLSDEALAWASALAYAGPMLAAIACTPLWGRLGDRVGHKPMVLRALFALAATQAWISCANDVASVLSARLLQGALAGFIAAAQAYGARLCTGRSRALMIARLQVATALGSVVGPLAGGLLYEALGFQRVNLVAAALAAACLLVAGWALPALPRTEADQARSAAALPQGTDRQAAWSGLLLVIVTVQVARSMPQVFFGLYTEKVLAVPPWMTGLCYGATALGLCLGAPLWARRFERLDRRRALAESAWIAWICMLLALAQLPVVPMSGLLAARFAWGLALGALLPVFYAQLSLAASEGAQGLALGWGNAAAKTGALVGSVLGGVATAVVPGPLLMIPVAMAYAGAALVMHRLRATVVSSNPRSAAE